MVIMVGLPARGKTFLSVRLQRYLEWQGRAARIFNAGSYRRSLLGLDSSRSDFFDPRAVEYKKKREMIAKACFADLSQWLTEVGDVAIYDATNVTKPRREYLAGECAARGFDCLFVENICDDPEILERIVEVKVTRSVDYKNAVDMEAARRDFAERIDHYESVYHPVGPPEAYVKIFNFGRRVEKSFPAGSGIFEEIARYLGCINLAKKDIYLTRHGESFYNLEDRIGGDAPLTEKGIEYARRLGEFFSGRDMVVLTSAKKRTIQTAEFLDCEKKVLEELNEIDSGICDGLTYAEIKDRHPEIAQARSLDKLDFRYPGGESYRDLIGRLSSAVVDIEAQNKDVLVVAHRAVNRCLFSYFTPTPAREIPYLEMPLERVIRVFHKRALYAYEGLSLGEGR